MKWAEITGKRLDLTRICQNVRSNLRGGAMLESNYCTPD